MTRIYVFSIIAFDQIQPLPGSNGREYLTWVAPDFKEMLWLMVLVLVPKDTCMWHLEQDRYPKLNFSRTLSLQNTFKTQEISLLPWCSISSVLHSLIFRTFEIFLNVLPRGNSSWESWGWFTFLKLISRVSIGSVSFLHWEAAVGNWGN